MYQPKKLYWDDSLKTGDDNLDFQHKYLFETFNKLSDAILYDHGKDNISTIIERLKFYAEWHFGKEEKCMADHRCPIADKNKSAHAIFMDMLKNYAEEYIQSGGANELAIRMHETLSDWFLNHVQRIDTNLYPCIHKK